MQNQHFVLCRFQIPYYNEPKVGLVLDREEGVIGDLTPKGINSIEQLAKMSSGHMLQELRLLSKTKLQRFDEGRCAGFLTPIGEKQSVWAAGVTYKNSVLAREEESGSNIYANVYHDERPEEFPKALSGRDVVSPYDTIGIRSDSDWNVPEPELVIVFNSKGGIVGYTIGNDVSSRDIEGKNPLYLPQAKVYENSFAAGPVLVVGPKEEEVKTWKVNLKIYRNGETIFNGESTVGNMNRTFTELRDCLFNYSSDFHYGVALSTGTDLVPGTPEKRFTLEPDDLVEISISVIGTLKNRVGVIRPRTDLEPVE
ncbi:MAG: fumarylacetoacetate hydrolase family protein [Candidatus Melainabacteria bacterium]|nr:fumarylacetoacetate hydrolase family protein [Candidatus Melainabacteria bacterium]